MALVAQDPSAGFRSTGSFFEALVAQGGEGPRLLLLSHFEVEGGGNDYYYFLVAQDASVWPS